MKKLLIILFCLSTYAAQSQVLQEPTIYGTLYRIIGGKEAILVPTGNGVPILPTPLKKYKQGAIAIDSLHKKFYFYNPSDSSWNEAGLSQSTVDSILGGYYTRGQVDSIVAVTKSLFNGGTTGQTLVKNSNTDLDFSWSTPAAGGTTSIQTYTLSSGSKIATFTSVPATYADYEIFRWGVRLYPVTDYTTSGNNVTILDGEDGEKITFQRIK